jgi:hypothetical protein
LLTGLGVEIGVRVGLDEDELVAFLVEVGVRVDLDG